jgi:hypothetical protein
MDPPPAATRAGPYRFHEVEGGAWSGVVDEIEVSRVEVAERHRLIAGHGVVDRGMEHSECLLRGLDYFVRAVRVSQVCDE